METSIFGNNKLDKPSVVFLSSYLPRECGLATFTSDLVRSTGNLYPHLATPVVAIDDEASPYRWPSEVTLTIRRNVFSDYEEAAQEINDSVASLVNIQHEYGLFGGEDGEYVLAFMEETEKPIVTTLHTVLPNPSPHFRKITKQVCDLSAAVVVLSTTARSILTENYGIDPSKIHFIPHGVPNVLRKPGTRRGVRQYLGFPSRKIVTTFGLISPNKGIEYVIQALPTVVSHHPDLLYIVLGETHPVLRRAGGESYRHHLQEMVRELGLSHHVLFVNKFLDLSELIKYLLASHVYVMPYLNPDQIVSGTLAYAIGVGKAVIATPFIYARELLGNGRGMIVNFRDPEGIAQALMALLWNPEQLYDMEERAYQYGRKMVWASVVNQYMGLFEDIQRRGVVFPIIPSWGLAPQKEPVQSVPKPAEPLPLTPRSENIRAAS
ncbi:MAG: glycosyltransferase family 4 protein [Chloroflexi bacterium]|nr:glycosyltransferase family 4 protein [Chloroflexota bacterium]